jgi:L-seryl-tRNA(Ser) seleniumtransferase
MLGLSPEDIGRRAKKVAAALRKVLPEEVGVTVEDAESQVGSGAVPFETLPTKVLAVTSASLPPDALATALRRLDPPVFARVSRDSVLLDFRTVQPDEDAVVEAALKHLLNKEGQFPPGGTVPSPAS